MISGIRNRCLRLLASISIYNEHRGYTAIDRVLEAVRVRSPDDHALIADDALFERLCRIIALTERRGHRQVGILLRHPLVRDDKVMMRIFRIVEQDEPSHWQPYEGWLAAHGKRPSAWWERALDTFVHAELLFLKLPALFVSPWLGRRREWADAQDPAERLASPMPLPIAA